MKTFYKRVMYLMIILMICPIFDIGTIANEMPAKTHKISGKNIAFIGDSLTSSTGMKKYIDVIKENTNANCYNFGVNESAIAINDIRENSFIARYKDIFSKYPKDSFDIIVIFGGVNDCAYNVPLGDMSTGNHTFVGALSEVVYNMQSHYPKAKIVLMTPLIATYNGYMFDYTKNNEHLFLEDYRQGIRLVAKMLGAVVYDTNMYSGLNPNNGYMSETYYSSREDGVHPNEEGHKRIAEPLINLLDNLY